MPIINTAIASKAIRVPRCVRSFVNSEMSVAVTSRRPPR